MIHNILMIIDFVNKNIHKLIKLCIFSEIKYIPQFNNKKIFTWIKPVNMLKKQKKYKKNWIIKQVMHRVINSCG